MSKIISIFMTIIMFLFPAANIPEVNVDKTEFNTDYTYVLVHGFAGWGDYNWYNKLLPYWGVRNGDLTKYLGARGFDVHAATVSPTSSAWDRACELYAQLTGTVTDYGKAHSEECRHARYGKDYSDSRLISDWSADKKVNLVGHSFGGATVRMLAWLMANGSEEEMNSGTDVSELFKGGKEDWVYSVITLSSPHNGTSSYDVQLTLENDPNATAQEKMIAKVMLGISDKLSDGRVESDTAIYEMQIDNAMALNEKVGTVDSVYYFSYACDGTIVGEDGVRRSDDEVLSGMYKICSDRLVNFTGVTPNGYVIDEKWQANDGLINTYSALAPIGAPSVKFDQDNINPGIWNVMPVQRGSHTTLQGGMTDYFNSRLFFVDLFSMIDKI